MCLVYELLGRSIRDELEKAGAFTFDQTRAVSRQLFKAMEFLHSKDITHTDLKPENICFVRSTVRRRLDTDVKIIDFGNCFFRGDARIGVVGTMPYRAVESVVGLPWSHPVDAWAVGCIMFEMHHGSPLFTVTESAAEHLHLMQRILGVIPRRIGK